MDLILSKYNQNKRNGKRIISADYIIRKRGTLLHVCLNSPGCRYRNAGSCTMCDYGQGKKLTDKKVEKILPHIRKAAIGMQSILIGTLGSVLDSQEISLKCLGKICDTLNAIPIKTIIFETHYTMIDEKICQWLKQHLPEKDIVIEVGIESVDEFVQQKCLNKIIDILVLKSKIEVLHNYGISITANVFLGAPFLDVREQIEDTEKTIKWAINNDVDSVVIFPANIRKSTLLNILYKNQKYSPIQHWAIFELLCKIPLHYLNRIYLAWYGDWIDLDENGEVVNIPPCSCEVCKNKWMDFYQQFLSVTDSMERMNILHTYSKSMNLNCNCRNAFEKSFERTTNENRENRVEEIKNWLASQCE